MLLEEIDDLLESECAADGVSVLSGLEPMVDLVDGGHMTAAQARDVAERIHRANQLFITTAIVDKFTARLRSGVAKSPR